MKSVIYIIAGMLLMSCNGISTARHMNNAPAIPNLLQVGHNILSRDSIEPAEYSLITDDQRNDLKHITMLDVPDSTRYIGVRTVSQNITLEAYKVPTGEDVNQFKVILVTRDKNAAVADYLDLGEFHTSEHDGPMRFGGNRFHTTDAELRFEGDARLLLHRVMTLTSIYLKDHSLTEQWRAEWENDYEIDGNGRFIFKGQKLTYHSDPYNEPIVTEYMSRDLSDK